MKNIDLQDTVLAFGLISLEGGVAAIYWPAALILLGVLSLSAAILIERTKRKPHGKTQ